MTDYWHWLIVVSIVVALAERLRPARPLQPVWRPQLLNDAFYLAFNGFLYARIGIVATAGTWLAMKAQGLLSPYLPFATEGSGLARLPWAGQFLVYLLVADFLQWCVHVTLHRVPFLWQFHKVHHSVHQMDWIASFRFHWMENVVYKTAQYVPLALLGGDASPLFAVIVFSTLWGHFNHANLDLGIGPLAYVFNSPRMHLWHHDASSEGGTSKNYAIVLSLWDWLFRTAYWPRDRAPERIGYERDEEMPPDVPRQLVFPLLRRRA